jgi:hypothetical protein
MVNIRVAPVSILPPAVLQEVERFILLPHCRPGRLTRESEALHERNFVMHCDICLAEERKSMDDPNTTTGTFEAEEDILNYTVSDEAIEAAAGTGRAGEFINTTPWGPTNNGDWHPLCCR